MPAVTLPGGVVSLSAENADKLLATGNADAAMLYIALLRHGGELPPCRQTLGWSQGRLDGAYAALQQASLVGPAPASGPLRNDTPPDYVTQDVVSALERDGDFASLQRQVERELGSLLSPADLKTLYTVYDYLALPPEVILLLTSWCVEETERKYGQGRRPRMSVLKKEAFRWHDRGVDTLSAAEEFLQGQKGLAQRERALLPQLGIRDRSPLDKEREYIAAWFQDYGFSIPMIKLAYERTVERTGKLSFPYVNSILRSWYEKGVTTPKQALEERRPPEPGESVSSSMDLEEFDRMGLLHTPKLD